MKNLGVVFLACALLSGCADDEHIAAMNQPFENIPLSRSVEHEIVVPSKTPGGEDIVINRYETPGTVYPVYDSPQDLVSAQPVQP
jgi:hypothetical protein